MGIRWSSSNGREGPSLATPRVLSLGGEWSSYGAVNFKATVALIPNRLLTLVANAYKINDGVGSPRAQLSRKRLPHCTPFRETLPKALSQFLRIVMSVAVGCSRHLLPASAPPTDAAKFPCICSRTLSATWIWYRNVGRYLPGSFHFSFLFYGMSFFYKNAPEMGQRKAAYPVGSPHATKRA